VGKEKQGEKEDQKKSDHISTKTKRLLEKIL